MRLARIAVVFAFLLACVNTCPAAAPSTRPAKEAGAAGNPTVAVFDFRGPVSESPQEQDIFNLDEQPASLRDLTKRIRAAGDDDNVKAIVLVPDHVMAGRAQVEELRQAVKDVRAKNKEVYVHADAVMMGDYLLFSGATRISVSPTGVVVVPGLHGEQPYLRGLLDKIGVKPDFVHIGAYKSAIELFTRTEPSKEADEMINWLFDSIYDSSVQLIAEGRKVDADQAKKWIDEALFTADRAKEAGLIDAVEQRDDFDAMLKKKYGDSLVYDRKYGKPKKPTLDFSSPFAMFQILGEMMRGSKKTAEPGKDAVGIVYVDGPIITGSERPSIFGAGGAAYSTDLRKALDKAARDESIKAVVLRIDSPGGSATASEIILDATRRVKAKKPLVVSMGNVAGSGGYYVAMGADTIFADQSTITGSIGVLGGKFATNDMWKKIGITFKSYDRGQNANLFASDTLWNDEQRQTIMKLMEDVYGTFKKHVTDNRGEKLKKPIDDIAAGRVYTGKQALELGLVDKIGTLSDAIAFVAGQAKVSDYDVRIIPEPKNFIEKLLEKSSGSEDEEDNRSVFTSAAAGVNGRASLVELAMPYLKNLDPARVATIRAALEKLQLLNQEGVLLVMPQEFRFN
jgi:protease-4